MTSPDLVIYRALYRNLLIAALDAEIVATAADFAAMVAADAGASTMVSARAGDIKAVCAVCDAAEARVDAWLDAREDAPEGCDEWDENSEWRAAQWRRACDAQLDHIA